MVEKITHSFEINDMISLRISCLAGLFNNSGFCVTVIEDSYSWTQAVGGSNQLQLVW